MDKDFILDDPDDDMAYEDYDGGYDYSDSYDCGCCTCCGCDCDYEDEYIDYDDLDFFSGKDDNDL